MIYFSREFAGDRSTVSRQSANTAGPRSIEGTIQRVDYRKGEFTLIAEGRVWHFALCGESRFWFDGRPAPFRCFQPLDHARVFYELPRDGGAARVLYLWAEEKAGVGEGT